MKPDFTAYPLMKLDFKGGFELLSVRAVHWYACHLPKVKLQKLKSGKHAFVLPVERRKEGSQGVWGSQALLVTPNYVQRLWDMCIIPPLGLDWPPIPSTSPYPLRVDGPKEARWVPGMSSGALFHPQTC